MWVFSFDLKEESEEECMTERGREFQMTGPVYRIKLSRLSYFTAPMQVATNDLSSIASLPPLVATQPIPAPFFCAPMKYGLLSVSFRGYDNTNYGRDARKAADLKWMFGAYIAVVSGFDQNHGVWRSQRNQSWPFL